MSVARGIDLLGHGNMTVRPVARGRPKSVARYTVATCKVCQYEETMLGLLIRRYTC